MKRSSFIKIGALSVLCCILSSACNSGSKSNQSTASSEESAMPEESVKVEYIPEGWESIWNHIDFYADTEEGKTLCFKMTSPSTCMVTYQDKDNNESYAFGTVTIPTHVKWKGEVFAVTGIGDNSFKSCRSLGKIILPETIERIGKSAFGGCDGLSSISVKEGNPNYDSRDECNAIIETKTNTLILGSTNSKIPYGITCIGDNAFSGKGLTSIKIPDSVTCIGNYAFSGCSGLTSIEIPNSVTSIGYNAFDGCSGLTSIEIPNSVTSIENSAFAGCSGLTYIKIPDSVTRIGNYAFSGCSGLTSIEIPNGVTSIGSNAFSSCLGLTSIEIPSSVEIVGPFAFSWCKGLTSVKIIGSRTKIYIDAFSECTSLGDIDNWVPRSARKSY